MTKIIKMIPVLVDSNLSAHIDTFIKDGGVYSNLNNGVLSEPLMERQLSEYFESKVKFVNKSGYDYISESGIKIEFKFASITKNSASVKNIGDSKNVSDYIVIFNAFNNSLLIIETKLIMSVGLFSQDITNNKQNLNFHADMKYENKRDNTLIWANTVTLRDSAEVIML